MNKSLFKKSIAALTALLTATACFPAVTVTAKTGTLIDYNFDNGVADWGVYRESGGRASISSSEGRLALNVTSVGSVSYAVQVYRDIIPLYQNGVYRLKYDISCSIDRTVEGIIQQNGGTYQAYTMKKLSLTSTPQSIDYTFTMEAESDIMAKLLFNCGTPGTDLPEHTIYLDNVSLELIDDSNVDYTENQIYQPSIVLNQIGYKPQQEKVAVFRDITDETEFSVINADTKAEVYSGALYGETANPTADETDWFGDFSAVTAPGTYYISCGDLDDSYTFTVSDDAYSTLLDDTVKMLYLQRCGSDINDDVFGHKACHTSRATVYGTNETIDVSGGWHDAGDYGRYVVPAAKTIADLLYAYEANPELYSDSIGIPESGNGIPDILDETEYALQWMLKMQAESGGVYHKVTCATFPGYIMPEKEVGKLIVTPVSTTATADFCAVMAMAYEFYSDIDSDFANKCLAASEKAWAFLEENPNLIFENPKDITTGAYNDNNDRDERYWAAAQMYRATGEEKYLAAFQSVPTLKGQDWAMVGNYGNFAILTMDNIDTESSVYQNVKNSVISQADGFVKATNNSPYGVAVSKFNWGSNMTIANAGVVLGVAYRLTGSEDYLKAANDNLNYLLGKNPNAVCYVTGYGTVSPQQPHHRPSMAQNQPMPGMLVGGVNSNLEDSAAEAYLAYAPAAKCYIDNWESYSTNEVTTYWNSPLIYMLSFINSDDEAVSGDINLDGEFSVADIVYFQNYLLTANPLTEKQAVQADVCKDKLLDCFDLVILKKMLLGN